MSDASEYRCVFTFETTVVHAETEKTIKKASVLAKLDGVRDSVESDLVPLAGDGELPDIDVRSAIPMLRFLEKEKKLVLEICFVSGRAPSARDKEALSAFCTNQIESGWGSVYEFAYPDDPELDDLMVHFTSSPREKVKPTRSAVLAEVNARWPSFTYKTFAAMSDDDLAWLIARLAPYASSFVRGDAEGERVRELHTAAVSQRQRRAVDRLDSGG